MDELQLELGKRELAEAPTSVHPAALAYRGLVSDVQSLRTSLSRLAARLKSAQADLRPADLLYALYLVEEAADEVAELRKDLETGHGPQGMSEKDRLVKWAAAHMTKAGIDAITVAGVGFDLDADVKPSLPKEGTEEYADWLEWLRTNGGADIIKTGVAWQSAAAFVRRKMQEGMALPDYVKCFTVPRIKIRRK